MVACSRNSERSLDACDTSLQGDGADHVGQAPSPKLNDAVPASSLLAGARARGVLHLLSGRAFRVTRSGGGIGLVTGRVFGSAGRRRRLRRVLHLLTRSVARSAWRFCRLRKRRGCRQKRGRRDDQCLHVCFSLGHGGGASDVACRSLRFRTGTTWQSAGGFSGGPKFRSIAARNDTPAFTVGSGRRGAALEGAILTA